MKNSKTYDKAISNIHEIILNSIPSGIIFCDKDNKIRFINRTYAEYLDVNQEEVIGKHIKNYIPATRITHVLKTGQSELGFKCSVGEGKEKKVLIVNRIPVTGKNEEVMGVISQSLFGDIGELKDLSERLKLLEKKISTYREKFRSALSAQYSISDIKGDSKVIVKAKRLAKKYAKSDSSVLIDGPTGVGKELFAHAIHSESKLSNGPFVSINCAAIPHDLLESELFGYVPGAFTGALRTGKLGKVELADKGTLFFDEIGDMSLQAQVKLLRVLEDKLVFRLGANRPNKVSFRLIVATNRNLKQMIREGKFREDLFYRLNAMIIQLPPLTDRINDIPILVNHFLHYLDRTDVLFSPEAMKRLMQHNWPGNVRELKNAVECSLSLAGNDTKTIQLHDLPSNIGSISSSAGFNAMGCNPQTITLSDNECAVIKTTLENNNWNMAKTARLLGISRASLYEKAQRYKLTRPKPFN
jgi:transcriptional regulator with PAS, ATPase and Fis domain